MELTDQQNELIKSLVKNNPKFSENEDLIDDFCNETLKRSSSFIASFSKENDLEPYLNKVVNSAILEVLKKSGRLRKSKNSYKPAESISPAAIDSGIKTDNVDTPLENEPPSLKKEIKTIRDAIFEIDQQDKDKQYLDIFTFRYLKGLKQFEIAFELNISQEEVSKRLAELAKRISSKISAGL